jgi:hypothetical protein
MNNNKGVPKKTKDPVFSANAFLSPAYWGSLFAFLFGLCTALLITVFKGPPDYLFPLPEVSEGDFLVVITAIVVVTAYVVRYYSAVAVSLFGLTEYSLFCSPKSFRKVLFWWLACIIFLSGVNSFVVAIVGIIPALVLCIVQSLAAIVSLGAIWVGKQFSPQLLQDATVPFSGGEVFFLAAVGYLLFIFLTPSPNGVESNSLVIGGIVAWTIWFTVHEWLHQYATRIRTQYRALQDTLSNDVNSST